MYARSLTISEFKCIGDAELKFQYPGRKGRDVSSISNVNLILGDNGGGKSSVLRAIALAILNPVLRHSGFVPYRLVRRARTGEHSIKTAEIQVEVVLDRLDRDLSGADAARTTLGARIAAEADSDLDRMRPVRSINPSIDKKLLSSREGFFLVGYGATRTVDNSRYSSSHSQKSRGVRYQRVAGLFEELVPLWPIEQWLPRLNEIFPDNAEEVIDLLNGVLPDCIALERPDALYTNSALDTPQYLFQFNGVPTPFMSLSDGYKSYIGWVGDLLGRLAEATRPGERIDSLTGVVLVDEIDLHLHPDWQRTVISKLAGVFPKLQFFFTSHSAIVASTVKHTNIFVTETDEAGMATVRQLEEKTYGRGVEDLLLSSYFGLVSARPERLRAESTDLFRRASEGDSKAALQFLKSLRKPISSNEE